MDIKMKSIIKHRTLFLLLLAAGIILTGASCKKEKKVEHQAVKVRAMLPEHKVFKNRLTIHGNIEPDEYARICAKTEGTIDVMDVDEGDVVKKDQLLFQMDKLNLESAVEAAKQDLKVSESMYKVEVGNLAIAKAKYNKALKDHERSKKLIKYKAIAEDIFERTELQSTEAELGIKLAEASMLAFSAKVDKAKSDLAIAQKYYRDSLVKAPFNGVVVKRYMEQGEYAKKAEPILKLENLDTLEISLFLSGKYYSLIKPGKTPVNVYSKEGKKLLETTIAYCSPTIDSESRTFEVEIALPKREIFVSGMICKVDIILESSDGYGVPKEAVLQRGNGKSIIFVSENGKAKEIAVEKGISDGDFVELKNVDHNLPVVVAGQAFLNDGDQISVIKTETEAAKPVAVVLNENKDKKEKASNVSK
jgi:RND family efflux transporter MFP subunit